MAVTDLQLRQPEQLSRAGEDTRLICQAWLSKPEGARFAEALVTFLGSKSNQGTQRVYSLALYEFFAWYMRQKGQIGLPNEVMRSDAARYVKWLEQRTETLDEERLALEPGRELDAAIVRFVRLNPGSSFAAIRRSLLSDEQFATNVLFTIRGTEHSTRVLRIEEQSPRGDDLARYVSMQGSKPVEPLDLKLAQLCSQNFLRRTPSVADIRAGRSGLKLEKPGQAQIGYRVDPNVFRYSINVRSTAQGGDRASTIVNKLSVLSAFWKWCVESSGENLAGHDALLAYNIWKEPIAALRPKAINRRKQHREQSVPDIELLATVLATTYAISHGKLAVDAAHSALQGVDLLSSATAEAPLVDLRDRAVILFLFWCGVRAEELSGVRRSELDDRTQLVTVLGKGDFLRSFRVPDPAMAAIREFQVALDSAHVAKLDSLRGLIRQDSAPLFPPLRLWGRATKGQPASGAEIDGITPSALGRMLRDRAEKAGIARNHPDFSRIHPHGLRHLAALEAVKRGVDVATVQATLGHRSLATTGIYLEVRDPMERTLQPGQPAAPSRLESQE